MGSKHVNTDLSTHSRFRIPVLSHIMAAMVLLELAVVLLHIVAISESAECNGCVVLDSKTFDRVLNKFDVMLVKFDKHDPDVQKQAVFDQIYNDLSKEYGMEDMMTAHVDIVKNGEA